MTTKRVTPALALVFICCTVSTWGANNAVAPTFTVNGKVLTRDYHEKLTDSSQQATLKMSVRANQPPRLTELQIVLVNPTGKASVQPVCQGGVCSATWEATETYNKVDTHSGIQIYGVAHYDSGLRKTSHRVTLSTVKGNSSSRILGSLILVCSIALLTSWSNL